MTEEKKDKHTALVIVSETNSLYPQLKKFLDNPDKSSKNNPIRRWESFRRLYTLPSLYYRLVSKDGKEETKHFTIENANHFPIVIKSKIDNNILLLVPDTRAISTSIVKTHKGKKVKWMNTTGLWTGSFINFINSHNTKVKDNA